MIPVERPRCSLENEILRPFYVDFHGIHTRDTRLLEDLVEWPRADFVAGDPLAVLRCVCSRKRSLSRIRARRREQFEGALCIRACYRLDRNGARAAGLNVAAQLLDGFRIRLDRKYMAGRSGYRSGFQRVVSNVG